MIVKVLCTATAPLYSLPTEGSQGGPYYVPGTGVLVLSGGVSGTYTCTGTNQFGSDRESVTITIVTKQCRLPLGYIHNYSAM